MKQKESSKTTRKFSVTRYSEEGSNKEEIEVVTESPFQILINDKQVATIMLTTEHLEEFLIGFLIGQGIVESLEDIEKILVEQDKGLLYAQVKEPFKLDLNKSFITSGCSGGVSFESFKDVEPVQRPKSPDLKAVLGLMKEMIGGGEIYRRSGGVHGAALADNNTIIFRVEDIGRHNCIDKVIGYLVKNKLEAEDKMILTSGRLSLEAIPKIARARIPILGSRSTPTDLAIELAKELNVLLLGYVRAGKLTVYS